MAGEALVIEALSFVLSLDGWRVHTHSGGHDAGEEMRRRRPDVLILDVMLPGCSGYDILRELRGDPAWRDLPVLMLTARGRSRDRDAAFAAGASAFLSKPFANAELLEIVRGLAAP